MSNLKLVVGSQEQELLRMTFPGGEQLIRIEGRNAFTIHGDGRALQGQITLDYKSDTDLIGLAMLVDAARRHYVQGIELSLEMPYLPYARQDRVCNPGEALSVKVVADFINSLGFKNVYVWNIHSDVGVALINNLRHVNLNNAAYRLVNVFHNKDTTVLVSPDAGAMKKTLDFAKQYGYKNVICADKSRDVLTGNITGINVRNISIKDLSMFNLLVLDDICDGGRTFIELAKAINDLSSCQSLSLYVTHGIFSAGTKELAKHYNRIYTSNLMNTTVEGVIVV